MTVDILTIPAINEMAQFHQWVLHNENKVPLRADGHGYAKSTDPTTWSRLDDAIDGLKSGNGVGLGFVFSESDPFVGIDLDNAIDEAGNCKPWAQKVVDLCSSYTEISMSGRGLHILIRAHLPEGWKGHTAEAGDGHIEVYQQVRYFAMTGSVLEDRDQIQERNIQLAKLGFDFGFLTPTEPHKEIPQSTNSNVRLPPFPLEVFPQDVRDFVRAVAETTKTSVDAVAFTALNAVSAIVGLWTEVQLTTSWCEQCTLYGCLVAPSGDGKTPIFKLVTEPLERLEAELQELAEPVVQDAQSTIEILETKIAGLKNVLKQEFKKQPPIPHKIESIETSIKELAEELDEARSVHLPTLITSDCTSEKLVMLLGQNRERMAVVSGDTPLFGLLSGRYTQGTPQIEIYLSAFNAEPYRDHRVGRPPNVLKTPRLAMLLGTQPCVIRDIRKKPELEDRGLVGRFLFCMPPSRRGYRNTKLVGMPEEIRNKYVLRMLALGREAQKRDESLRLFFSEEAAKRFEEWSEAIEPRLRPGEDLASLSSFPDKLRATVARISGLLHLLQSREGAEITPETFDDATKVVDFLIEHFREVFALISESPLLALAKRIREWADGKGYSNFTLRQVQNSGPGQRFKADEIREALQVLEAEGSLVLREENRRRGKPTVRATVL